MSTKLYIHSDKSSTADIVQLTSFFHEDHTLLFNSVKLKFASSLQIDIIKNMIQHRLLEQTHNQEKWAKLDKKLYTNCFIDFLQTQNMEASSFGIFSCDRITDNVEGQLSVLEEEWRAEKMNNIASVSGCDLTNRMCIINDPVNIRSKAFTLSLSFLLLGDSSLSIATRSQLNNQETTIVRFMKTGLGEEQRLFLFFGILDKLTNEIVYTKRSEIPIIYLDEMTKRKNFVEINCTIHDNGDQFLTVNGDINCSSKNEFKVVHEQVIPYFQDFKIRMYGEKSTVIMKQIKLNTVERKDFAQQKEEKETLSKCCSIF